MEGREPLKDLKQKSDVMLFFFQKGVFLCEMMTKERWQSHQLEAGLTLGWRQRWLMECGRGKESNKWTDL